jgi:anti-sigma regulatory factor (Ser/Thr protein kinase)/CheY-like chemotaxis protein
MPLPRLLVVDSDALLPDSLLKELKASLSETLISTVTSREQALELMAISSYEAAVVEIHSASPEDISFLQKIKLLCANISIIVLAHNNDSKLALQLFSLQIFAFMQKPPNDMQLIELIKAAIETATEGDGLKIISASPSWVEVVIPAHLNYIGRLSSFWQSFMEEMCEKELLRMLYAFRELIHNAIEHGSRFSPLKKAIIRYIKSKKAIVFYIEDEGEGFSLDCLPHAAISNKKSAPLEILQYRKQIGMRPGGLGISTVLTIADELIYNQRGNAVMMLKYLEK